MAVIRWKKFYADFRHEPFSACTIEGNVLISEERIA